MNNSTDPLIDTVNRLTAQFEQSAAGMIQIELDQAIRNWRHISSGRLNPVGTSSIIANDSARPADGDQLATVSNLHLPRQAQLSTTLLQRLEGLLQSRIGRSAGQPLTQTSPAAPATLSPLSEPVASSGWRLKPPSDELHPAGTPKSQSRDSTPQMQNRSPARTRLPGPATTLISQQVHRLMTQGSPSDVMSALKSRASQTEVTQSGFRPPVIQAQQPTFPLAGSAIDMTAQPALDRLHEAMRKQSASRESVTLVNGDFTERASDALSGKPATKVSTTSRQDDGDRSESRQNGGNTESTDDHRAISAAVAATSPRPQSGTPPDPHQAALAMIQGLKADARWNNQPTDVLKPLR